VYLARDSNNEPSPCLQTQFVVKEFYLEETPSMNMSAVEMEIEVCSALQKNKPTHLMKV